MTDSTSAHPESGRPASEDDGQNRPIEPLHTAPQPLPASEVPPHGEPEPEPTAPARKRFDLSRVNWKRVGILSAIGVVTALILFLIVYNLAPVWWARLIGDFTQEDLIRSALVGAIVGFAFTLIPLMILLLLMYRSPVWLKIVLVVVAVVLASPNLLTLWIQLDNSGATHAADRILDTDAFGFVGWSLAGAIVAGVAFLFWAWLFVARRRNKKQIATLKAGAADTGRSA